LSDIDFDDESTSDDLTDAPSTLNPKQELDHTLTKVANAADGGVGAKELSSAIDDQLLASITGPEAERVSKLELKALTARNHLEDALSDEPQDPVAVAAAKKLYTDALQNQLDFHDYLAQSYATFLTSDFQNKLTNEPLLSSDEIAKLNNNIRPADMAGRFVSPDQVTAARNAIDEATGKDNPGEDFFRTPARLQQHNEAVRKAASELSLPDGWDVVFDDENALAEIAKIPGRLERQAAYKGYALNSRPRHLVIKHRDPALNKHNLMFELDPNDSSMMATPDEVNTLLNALTEFHSKIDISNLQNILAGSYISTFNPTGAIDIKLGRHAPLRSGDIGVDSVSKAVINAATGTNGQLYINIDRMRLFDTPEFRKEKEGFYWNENKSSLEKIKTTLHHELGHQIQYATTDTKNPEKIKGEAEHAGEDGEVNNTYAVVSNGEHFAESVGRYISTGEATDRVKGILESNGLIKSTEPEQLAAAEGAPEPFAGATTVAQVQGVLKKAGTYLSTVSNGKYYRSTGVYAVASDRNGGNSYKEVRKKYKKSRGQGVYWDTVREPIREAVIVGYNENAATESPEYAAERLIRNNRAVDKAVEALRLAGFTATRMEGEEYKFLVTKKVAAPTPDAEGAPSSLDNLGIDFQSATMDASGTRLPTPGAFTGEFQNIMKGAKSWKDVQERLKDKTITYFDFETTGISDYDGQDITNDSVQLGAVQVRNGKIVKRFNVYTNPESKLSEWSAKNLGRDVLDENGNRILDENGKPKTTPVTPEWLAQQKSKNDAIREFMEFIGPNALLGGQNVPFDIEILKRMAADAGVELDIAGTIDSKDLASLLPKYDPEKGTDGPKAPDRKTGEIKATSSLGPVANFLGFEPANWHSADGDAEDSYNLVSKIIDRAAAEDNQDLSLLDFPAMKKRYEERMAEFKNVVSPNNPITENQQKALEEFSNSNNPEISKLAKDTLATATTRGDAAKALAELHSLQPENIAPDAEGTPESIKPARNEALDIDLSDFDFDDDGELEPNEIKAAAKAIAASGHGMKLDGRKSDSERAIDTKGTKISIADSTRTAQAPSQQATDVKNSIIELGSKVREAAEKKAEAKLRKELDIPDDADVKEFISNKIREIEHENQRIDTEIMNSRGQLQAMLFSEIEKEAATITEEDLKAYLREARHYDEGISEEEIAQATLDNNYRPKIGRWGIPYNISPDSKSGASFDTGNAISYNFGNSYLNTKTTNRIRLAAVRLAEKSKNSDYPEIQKLAEEAKAKADIQAKNREKLVDIKEKRTFASRDALVETLKENGVEFDSVDMSQYIGKWEPRLRRYSENSKLSKKTRAEIEKAFQYIPKDFLLAAISYLKTTRDASSNPYAHMGRIRIIESGARAHYYSDGGNGGVIRGDDHGDFVHEFWHFFQQINPDIGALEHAFTYDRIKDQNGNLPSVESKDWSFVFNGGNFVSSYTSKQYPRGGVGDFSPSNRSTEVGSTGMEDLFTSPGRYSTPGGGWWADAPTLIVGSGRNRSSYRNPHMDIATGIWYTDSSMATKIPGQDLPNQKTYLKGRLDSLGEDTEFRNFNIGMLLSMLDWNSK